MSSHARQFVYHAKGQGACCTRITIELDGDIIRRVEFVDGCWGNHQGIQNLVRGQKVQEVIERLRGIQCRNGTSCPDQLSVALDKALSGELK
jgi:uncharacterized protein (TIGR03905 family)